MKEIYMKSIWIALFFIIFNTSILANEPIKPIPLKVDYNLEKAKLGKKLFFDSRLSKDNTISCASCHNLHDGGDDNLPFSFGINGQTGHINSPTVLNSYFNFRQFWNGRAKTLKDQVFFPIENPQEMGHNLNDLLIILKNNSYYKKQFKLLYSNEGITKNSISDAIAEFEKTLITPNAPFDKYLKGNINALTKQQIKGYKLFKTKGCVSCHNGINIGGNLYSRIGIVNKVSFKDKGLYEITKNKEDMYLFKVPSLRNIELTAPYFHDGSIDNLYDTVQKIALVQLGTKLSDQETQDIVSFLKSLTGELELIND